MTSTSFAHEQLIVRRGRRSGVTTAVAIHSTTLGPAIGGCRLKPYPSLDSAIEDVLRLSSAMTLKCAAAEVAFGGGKSVIAAPETLTPQRRYEAMLDHADLVAELGGTYLAGPDIGTGTQDMDLLSPNAFCATTGAGSSSFPTALGVLAALRAARPDLAGLSAVIIGFGSVGTYLAEHLAAAGVQVTVSDVDPHGRERASGFTWIDPDRALSADCDILIPAATGGVLTPDTVPALRAPLVVGPANNQLSDDGVADRLAAAGVTWIPDFIASAGGIIHTLAREVDGVPHEEALNRVNAIECRTATILAAARHSGATPLAEALALANARLGSPFEPGGGGWGATTSGTRCP
ncbi:Glu/Leu/Phe/Val dehydrogenase dimerization domain-containing protein [Actinokineospora auranticolor]|uniref:Leucine dehydrogenase n=1 Tax=Actinokineospora auranticolor TaxID=155976 RepID=A0A2S6GUH6_9PSEU|nr:Glu/Leu/Phe/Val dehydrogenase dimerization domain-containing protein [Actinokineospora auranticolor]PPK68843.1 leucine dehydrogenase [Actinokineospora auranticolor]